jgi:crossover junction endodeoxyribonuclease RusA
VSVAAKPFVEFEVPGPPLAQGSLVRTKWGVRDDNPLLKPWRAGVSVHAYNAMKGRAPTRLAVRLEAEFSFPHPKAHFRTGKFAGMLKPTAPFYKTSWPDIDKLERAILDAMTNIVFADDAQVVEVSKRKVYGIPRVHVRILELEHATVE